MLHEQEMKKRITEITNNNGFEISNYKIAIHGPCDIYITLDIQKGEQNFRLDEVHLDPMGHQDELFEYYSKIIQHTGKSPWVKS